MFLILSFAVSEVLSDADLMIKIKNNVKITILFLVDIVGNYILLFVRQNVLII